MTRACLTSALLAAFAAFSPTLSADLVVGFTTLDAAGTIPATASWGIADPGTPYGPSAALEIAVPFVMAAGGALDSVELPFARKSLTASSTTPRTFSLAADAGGKPGAVIESWSMVPGLTMSLVRLSSTVRPALAAGTKYWFTAHINPTGTAADAWVSNGLGLTGTMLYRRSVTVAYASFTGAIPAFRVKVGDSGVTPVNQAPVAQISAAPTTGTAPLAVAFSAADSYDPDGSIVAYQWSFGDGTTSTEARPTHTFNAAGVYTVALTVRDNCVPAAQDSVQTTITVDASVDGLTIGFTTLDAAGTIPATASWGIADPGTPYGPSAALEIAVPFVMAAGGALDSVELPFARKSLTASSTTPRTFSLAADAGGKPGAVLESWCMVPGLTMSLVRLSSTARPPLAAGVKYWFTAHINPTGTAADAWVSNGLGLTGRCSTAGR